MRRVEGGYGTHEERRQTRGLRRDGTVPGIGDETWDERARY